MLSSAGGTQALGSADSRLTTAALAALAASGSSTQARDADSVARGTAAAANATLLVAGLARNTVGTLPRLRSRLRRLGRWFAGYSVVLVENDSSDGTLQYLERWARETGQAPNGQLRLLSLSLAKDPAVGPYARRSDLKERGWGHDGVQLLARLRNRYLDAADRGARPDVLLMVDTDLGDDWEDEAVLEALGHEAHWDVLCSHAWYRDDALYDAFALRSPGLQPHDPAAFERSYGKSFFPHALCGSQRPGRDPKGAADAPGALVPVESCFGGLALYRGVALEGLGKACRYDEAVNDCEHVAIHRCLREQGAAVALFPAWRARAAASNSTCCVETCAQADRFPMASLPFEPQFISEARLL